MGSDCLQMLHAVVTKMYSRRKREVWPCQLNIAEDQGNSIPPCCSSGHPMQTSHQRNLLIPTDIVLEWTVGAVPGARLKSRSGLEREFAPCWRRSRVASSRVEV